jgi:two-component system sensor histidine kinase DesK
MMNGMGEGTRATGPDDRQPSGRRRWELGAVVAQLFMIPFYVGVVTSDLSIGTQIWALLVLVAFTAVYILLPGRCFGRPLPAKIAVTGILMALTVPLFAVVGSATATLWIFVAVVGGMFYPTAVALGLGLVLAAAMLLVEFAYGEPLAWELALTMIALTAFMAGFAGNIRLNLELRRTRDDLAVAAVAAERERIGRDLHDILGHSLTAITVKAGLARRLLGRDDVAAAAEIGDVERLAREALADVRATASGFREVSLATELAVAGNVLRAAGIAAQLPAAVDDVDPSARVLFGYVVREAVTNVVRHAQARTCTITVGPRSVEVVDDGTRGIATPGNGLSGLAERVRAAGGTLTAGPRPGGGFAVLATVPVPTPDPAVPVLHREGR